MMENENLHRAVKLSSTKLRKIFNTAALYEMMRRADRAVQYGVTLSITNNYMVKNDQLVNINEYIRQTFKLNGKSYSELLTEGNINLINQARKEKIPITIYLTNGFQFKGMVRGFDNYIVILDCEGRQNMVYKHAISTIAPVASIQIMVAEKAEKKE